MIRSFADSDTEGVFDDRCPKGFPTQLFKAARRKLLMVDAAKQLDDLKAPPGNKLHALSKERQGQHAIWVNRQYRVCFTWRNGDAYDVEVTDYHDD
jgi:proteic killer suppression protein